MALPFFYIANYQEETSLLLDEDTSRHVAQVLRMQEGEQLHLTDGNGSLLLAEITQAHKKHTAVRILQTRKKDASARRVTIAVSLVKNASRFEWFLEKATEIGVAEIVPLICERTEKERFRHDRMNTICISAMLQSQQCWLPVLHEPVSLPDFLVQDKAEQKFIAHCITGEDKRALSTFQPFNSSTILIGPEGDFTPNEITEALHLGYIPVSLGDTRLRTETAGVVAAALLANG